MGYPTKFHQQKKGFIPQPDKKPKKENKFPELTPEGILIDGAAAWKVKYGGQNYLIKGSTDKLSDAEIMDLWKMTPMTSMPLSTGRRVVIKTGCSGSLAWTSITPEKEQEVIPIEQTEESKQINQETMQLKEVLNQKFVNINEVAEILEIGNVTKKNVFLYGRGGHAKSEIIQEFLKHVDSSGSESFVQACGEGLTEEKLFGGLNLAKFQKTGEIEYLVENSFMNKKYVVFEELLDSRMNVLLSLKDILTSGIFRQGSQQFRIKTEFVICLTNRTKQEVAEDNSIKALMERFPLEMKVEWPKYEAEDYSAMFNKVLKNSLNEVAAICQSINESGDFVSPRTAIHMAQVYLSTRSIANLKYFGATKEIIERMEKLNKERTEKELILNNARDYNSYVGSVKPISIEDYKSVMKSVKNKLAAINGRSYSDKNHGEYASLRTSMETKIKEYQQAVLKLIEND